METGALAVRATGLHALIPSAELLSFLVRSVFAAETAVLAEFQFCGRRLLVFGCCIVPLLAYGAAEGNYISHVRIL